MDQYREVYKVELLGILQQFNLSCPNCYPSGQNLSEIIESQLDATEASTFSSVSVTIISILFFILGISGLSLNIIVFSVMIDSSKIRKNPSNVFIISLIICDVLMCLLNIPLTLIWLIFKSSILIGIHCKFIPFVQELVTIMSSLTISVIALDRLVRVRRKTPMNSHTKRIFLLRSIKIMIFIVIFSFLICTPIFHYHKHQETVFSGTVSKDYCINSASFEFKKFYSIMIFSLNFLIPSVSLCSTVVSVRNYLAKNTSRVTFDNKLAPVVTINIDDAACTDQSVESGSTSDNSARGLQGSCLNINYQSSSNLQGSSLHQMESKDRIAPDDASHASDAPSTSHIIRTPSSASRRGNISSNPVLDKSSASIRTAIVTRLLIKVTSYFILCTLPVNLFNLLNDFRFLDSTSDTFFDSVFTLTHFVTLTTVITNSYFYGILNPEVNDKIRILIDEHVKACIQSGTQSVVIDSVADANQGDANQGDANQRDANRGDADCGDTNTTDEDQRKGSRSNEGPTTNCNKKETLGYKNYRYHTDTNLNGNYQKDVNGRRDAEWKGDIIFHSEPYQETERSSNQSNGMIFSLMNGHQNVETPLSVGDSDSNRDAKVEVRKASIKNERGNSFHGQKNSNQIRPYLRDAMEETPRETLSGSCVQLKLVSVSTDTYSVSSNQICTSYF